MRLLDGFYKLLRLLICDKASECLLYSNLLLLSTAHITKRPNITGSYVSFSILIPDTVQKLITHIKIKSLSLYLFLIMVADLQLVFDYNYTLNIKIKLGA